MHRSLQQNPNNTTNLLAGADDLINPNDADYQRTVYEAPTIAEYWTNVPRMGHDSDISLLGNPSGTDQTDYLQGVCFRAYLAGGIFVLWDLVLVIFWCCGRKRVGFLAGGKLVADVAPRRKSSRHSSRSNNNNGKEDPQKATASPTDDVNGPASSSITPQVVDIDHRSSFIDYQSPSTDEMNVNKYNDVNNRNATKFREAPPQLRRHNVIRAIFLLAGTCFMVASILNYTLGFDEAQKAMQAIHDGSSQTSDISYNVSIVIDQEIRSGLSRALAARDSVVMLLTNKTSVCAATPTSEETQLSEELQKLQDFGNATINDLYDASWTIHDYSSEVANATGSDESYANELKAPALIWLLFSLALPILLMAAVVLAHYNVEFGRCTNCLLTWLVVPLMFLFTFLAMFFAAGISVMAVVNADFCVPPPMAETIGANISKDAISISQLGGVVSPDVTLYRLMQEQGYNPTTFTYRAAQFYISQCVIGNDAFADLRKLTVNLNGTTADIAEFSYILFPPINSSDVTALQPDCNATLVTLNSTLVEISSIMVQLITAIVKILSELECPNVAPIYTRTVYDGMCDHSLLALNWAYMTALVTGVMGMIMITLRAAIRPTERIVKTNYTGPGNDSTYDYDYKMQNNPNYESGQGGFAEETPHTRGLTEGTPALPYGASAEMSVASGVDPQTSGYMMQQQQQAPPPQAYGGSPYGAPAPSPHGSYHAAASPGYGAQPAHDADWLKDDVIVPDTH